MTLSEQQVKFFADYIQKNLGIIYATQNYYQLQNRLEEVCKILQIPSLEELYQQATAGISGNMKQVLLDISTNNETSFFRDPNVFKALNDVVFPEVVKAHPSSPFRIWSCASSFGQEPYSLAMLVHEYSQAHPGSPRFDIISTDISDHALNRAKAGVYSQLEVQRGLSTPRLVKFMTKDGENNWALNAEIRNQVKFSKQNLLDSFSLLGTFNLILCRHVLIYQADDKKKDVIARLTQCLTPKGFLVLGGTESLIGLSSEFDQVACQGAMVYRRKN